mgnify:CR=1 FL=1
MSGKEKGRRKTTIFLALFLTSIAIIDTARFLKKVEDRTPTLKRWLPFAAELGQDDRLYDRHPDYLYPPGFLVLLRPLTKVPLPVAAVIWQLSKYLCIAAIFAASWRMVSEERPLPLWGKVATVILSARFLVSDLQHGNINIYIAFLVIVSAWLLWTRREMLAGLLIALAATTKVTPVLWGAFLLYKRRWRALAGFFLGVVLFLEVLPLTVISADLNHRLLGRWYQHVIISFVSEGKIYSTKMNQSLAAVTNRLLGREEWTGGEDTQVIASLSDDAVTWIQRAAGAALLFAAGYVCRGKWPADDPMTLASHWGILAVIALALSGYTWTGHFCVLILGICVMIAQYRRKVESRLMSASQIIGAISFGLIIFSGDIISRAGRQFAAQIGLPLLSALLLGAALCLVVMGRRGSTQSEDRPPLESAG